MASKIFYQLDEVMPILISNSKQLLSNDLILVDSDNGDELDRIPDWVKKNVHLGNLGEYIVWLYLKQSRYGYKKVKWISRENDSIGYDISAQRFSEVYLFEVKASQNVSKDISFFLRMNELQAALRHPLNYIIFYIEIENERAYGTIIQNIALKINRFVRDGIIVKNDDIYISYEQLKITLPKSDTLTQIDLSNELYCIMKAKTKATTKPKTCISSP